MVLWASVFCPGPSSDPCGRVPAPLRGAGFASAEEEHLDFDSCLDIPHFKHLPLTLLPSSCILAWLQHGLICQTVFNKPTQTINHLGSLPPLPSCDRWQFGFENNSPDLTDLISFSGEIAGLVAKDN